MRRAPSDACRDGRRELTAAVSPSLGTPARRTPGGRLGVCVVSTASAAAPGGLSAYTAGLMRALTPLCLLSAAARFGNRAPALLDYAASEAARSVTWEQTSIPLVSPGSWAPALPWVHRLVDRRLGQRQAIALFTRAFSGALQRAVPSEADVIHVVGAGRELIGFPALAVARARRIAITVSPGSHTDQWGDGDLDLRLYRQADAVIAFTEHEAQHLHARGVPSARLHTSGLAPSVSAGGDGARFRARHGLGERPLVLFVGRAQRYKGFHALCEAMSIVLESHPSACLVAVGPRGEAPVPPVPSGAARILGEVDDSEKADAFAACDLLCMPSEGESFGLAYVEAWAYGKAVIAGSSPAARELVTDGEDGLWTENAAGPIAAAIRHLLDDPVLRRRLGEAGRRRQAAHFTWEAAAERHLAVFAGVKRGPRP